MHECYKKCKNKISIKLYNESKIKRKRLRHSELFERYKLSYLHFIKHYYGTPASKLQMAKQWFVVGISGATCSGKSTLANKIHDYFPTSVLVCQDNYFLPPDDPRHVKIQELNHLNWELSTSLDMQKMYSDVIRILQSPEKNPTDSKTLLILDGFLLFEHKAITDLCDCKYFLTLTKEQCWKRRKNRIYEPPDVPGYFDKIVWPEFVKYKNEVIQNNELYETVTFIDGSKDMEEICEMVLKKIGQLLS